MSATLILPRYPHRADPATVCRTIARHLGIPASWHVVWDGTIGDIHMDVSAAHPRDVRDACELYLDPVDVTYRIVGGVGRMSTTSPDANRAGRL